VVPVVFELVVAPEPVVPPAVPLMPWVALPGPLDGAGRVLFMLLLEPRLLALPP
jgi:hypothetical protein